MRDFFLYIHTYDALPRFPRPDCIGKETRTAGDNYRNEGKWKKDRSRVIFQYTLAGRGTFEDAKGRYDVKPGTGFLCESHDPQMRYFYPTRGTEPWQFLFLDVMGSAAHTLTRDLLRRFGPLFQMPEESTLIRQLKSFHVYHEIGCTLSLAESTRLATDLFNTLTGSKTAIPEKHADHALIRRFQEIVQSEIARVLSVGEIAERLNISAEHLARIFKQQTGISPHVHIQNAKMLAACSMLKSESLTIKEIAWRLGYETPANFMRTFQRVVKCTPLQFRRNGVVPLSFGLPDPNQRAPRRVKGDVAD